MSTPGQRGGGGKVCRLFDFGDTAVQGQGFCQGEEHRWRWKRGGGKFFLMTSFHGSLPEEALIVFKQRVTMIPNRV